MEAMRNSLSLIALLLLSPQFVAAQVVISEIMYDVPGSDSKAEWIELQNIGTEAVDISKWKFNDGSNHILNVPPKNGSIGTLSIPSGGYLLLAADAGAFLSGHTVVVSVIDTTMSLGNDSGKISVLDEGGKAMAKASYSSSKGAGGTGESLQLVDGKWKHAKPTPGSLNTSEAMAKPVPAVTKAAPKSKKVAVAKPKPEILDGTSTVAQIDDPLVAVESQLASAVVPLSRTGNSLLSWAFGALSIGVAGAGAVFVTRQKKRGEWDIEEIKD